MGKIKVLVVGCNGAMGQIVCQQISESNDMEVVAGLDRIAREFPVFPVFESIADLVAFISENLDGDYKIINEDIFPDVIIDFSHPNCTRNVLEDISAEYGIPHVIATTGFSKEDLSHIEDFLSTETLIFMASNMSYEINLLKRVLEMVAPQLAEDHDIEIVESHHSRKKDAPSGTAKTLASAINASLDNRMNIIYGREGQRESNEIGIASMRGGNIVGEHSICFCGQSDELIITHRAFSRSLFAEGSLKAARFLYNLHNKEGFSYGMYGMDDLQ